MKRSVVVKRELSQKERLSIYRSIYIPTLSNGHELWIGIKRLRSLMQVAERNFYRRVGRLSIRDRVRSSDIRVRLRVELLHFDAEREPVDVVQTCGQDAS